MTRLFPTVLMLAVLTGPALPAFAQDTDHEREQQEIYTTCMAMTEDDADAAYDMAQTWAKTGGGVPALHCAAIAQVRLQQYEAAGATFEDMIAKASTANPELLANIYAQAGNAWLLANYALRAYDLFTAGIKLLPLSSPERVELLIDRARALTLADDDKGALADLDAANDAAPDRADILTLKASSHRKLRQYDAAKAALAQALSLEPDFGEALLERGNLRITLGEEAGARADWVRFLVLYPDSPEAEAIRRNLERLDVKVEDFTSEGN